MQAINECLKRTIDETLLSDLLNNALKIASGLEGKVKCFSRFCNCHNLPLTPVSFMAENTACQFFLNLQFFGLIFFRPLLFE